MQIISEDAQ